MFYQSYSMVLNHYELRRTLDHRSPFKIKYSNISHTMNRHALKQYLRLYITGFCMGLADLIPGVSGGTIAFLSGIYEELLWSIKTVTGKVLRLIIHGKIVAAVRLVPFRFLIPLGLGITTALFSLARLLSWLLITHPVFVWSFFFGLVLASTIIVLKRVVKWDTSDKIAFVGAAVVAYILVGITPVETPTNPLFIFFSGVIAICAMILPGISGSFILLLLGKYNQILTAVVERDVTVLLIFTAGCIVGLSLFARFLSWLFSQHHDISVAVLAGLMLGSIRKVWPWKEVVQTRVNSHGVEVPLLEKNVLPATFDIWIIFAILLCILAIGIVFYLDRKKLVKEQTQDLASEDFAQEHVSSLKNY